MNPTDVFTIFLGLMGRLALPAALTILAAWILHRLDRLWMSESLKPVLRADGRTVSLSEAHCWEVFDCPVERRNACQAYLRSGQDCWDVFRMNGQLQEACQRCPLRKQKMALAAS